LTVSTLTTKKTRDTISGYHFQPLRHQKKVVQLSTLVPDDETLTNPRYIDVEEHFNIPRRTVKVHDCRIIVGEDMYLVSGYWYRYGGINRSVKAATGLTWRGELVVVKAGRMIPYLRRVNRPHQAEIAAKKYVSCFLPLLHSVLTQSLPQVYPQIQVMPRPRKAFPDHDYRLDRQTWD